MFQKPTKQSNLYRLFFDVIFLTSIFILPWWVTVAFMVVFMFTFESYFEIIVFGIIFDVIYGVPDIFPLSAYVFTIGSIALYLSVHYLKQRIIIYR